MKSNTFTYCIIVTVTILITKFVMEEPSSPVEETYHKQLVVTLDSILDARFGADCCEEVIDSDDATVTIDSVGRVIMPKD